MAETTNAENAKAPKTAKKAPTKVAKAPKAQSANSDAQTNSQLNSENASQASLHAKLDLTQIQNDPKLKGVRLHGKEFVGKVISDKAHKTVSVEWERRRLIKKFERYEKLYSRVYAHNPETISARTGDTVKVMETRPLSKTKNFVVIEVLRRASEDEQ